MIGTGASPCQTVRRRFIGWRIATRTPDRSRSRDSSLFEYPCDLVPFGPGDLAVRLVVYAVAGLDAAEHGGVETLGEPCDCDVSHGLRERREQASGRERGPRVGTQRRAHHSSGCLLATFP